MRSTEPEQDLGNLPTLPRFPAKACRPANAAAANAASMAAPPELTLAPIVERAPAREQAPIVEPAPKPAQSSGGSLMHVPTITPAVAAERCLAEAAREFEAGHIDQPLWMRAVTQAGGDEAAARAAYLKARATAIRIARREVRHERAERRMRAIDELHAVPRAAVHGRGFADLLTPKRLVAALAIGGVVVAAGAWFALGDPAPTRAAVSAPANAGATPAASASGPAPASPALASPADDKVKSPAQELADKVAKLSAAGNWNLLVLYAAEWTRKDPDNPEAWLALGTGYLRLKQHYESAEALARAAALAPERPEAWRALGKAKAAWGATDEALAAYERALGIDDRDSVSLVETGRLQADKGDLAGAKSTLDRALALDATDVEALCAAASVAQKGGRAKDAQAYAQKAKSLGAECPAAAPEAPPMRVVGGRQPPAQGPARR